MGGVVKVFERAVKTVAKEVGVGPGRGPRQPAAPMAPIAPIAPVTPVTGATRAQREAAAARRARRAGRRSLLGGGRLGTGTDGEELQETLGG